jgi:hypothetical protein
MDAIKDELGKAAAYARSCAKRNYILAYMMSIIMVATSISACVIGSLGNEYRIFASSLAAFPAAMVGVSSIFKFEEKSKWFWQKTKLLESLLRSLTYEAADPAEISKQFSNVEINMEKEWITFGNPQQRRA